MLMGFGVMKRDTVGIGEFLTELPAPTKIAIMIAVDAIVLCGAVFASRFLRVPEFPVPNAGTLHLHLFGPVASVVALAWLGLYGTASRGHSMRIEARIVVGQLVACAAWIFYLQFFNLDGFPRSIAGIYPALACVGLVMVRRLAVTFLAPQSGKLPTRERTQVFIYGAGPEAMLLTESLERHGRYKPVAFFDTDYTLVGRSMRGLKVFDMADLSAVLSRYGARQVLIAKPGLSRSNRRILLDAFVSKGVSVKIVPDITEIAEGVVSPTTIRNVRIEDLLGRDTVDPDDQLLREAVAGKSVLITGAGGSIGSELARQSLKQNPAKLVLLDSNEFALFQIQREIESGLASRVQTELVVVLADVLDGALIGGVLDSHHVDVIFHAAAYKHVRMVQENPEVGVRNNVEGTRVVAEAAMSRNIERFVLISTDKAVRPTSIMGASKRLAEMVVQSLAAQKNSKTIFCMVRFGNVLGSTGSVVPIFQEQIEKGGPVTVTHPDVTRYFMVIPEAAQLVLQAGALARSGEVLVLDMGEPVKILQLAKAMIELAGFTVKSDENPDGDIEVRITGLREGEKMFEELEIGNDLSPTRHPRILRSTEIFLTRGELERKLKLLNDHLDKGQRQKAQALLMDMAFLAE
jgi:FlaA1/EpsC-like NDP-sugar epimerase